MKTYLSEVIGKQYAYKVKLLAITKPIKDGDWYSHSWFSYEMVHIAFEIVADDLDNILRNTTLTYRKVTNHHIYVTGSLRDWVNFHHYYSSQDELARAVYRILQDQFDFLKDDTNEKHSD